MTYDFGPPECCGKEMARFVSFTLDNTSDSLWICAICDEEITRSEWEKKCDAERDARAERNADATGNAAPFCNVDPFPFE